VKVESFGFAVRAFLVLTLTLVELPCGFCGGAQPSGGPAGASSSDQESLQVPAGTVLPVRLDHGFSSKNARVGQVIYRRA
jgi:hypothetical protein